MSIDLSSQSSILSGIADHIIIFGWRRNSNLGISNRQQKMLHERRTKKFHANMRNIQMSRIVLIYTYILYMYVAWQESLSIRIKTWRIDQSEVSFCVG